jgi:hypothetical protein
VKRALSWAAAALLFALLATANSGGYRFGTSDQAFYEPAVAMSANPALFPRDRVLLDAQMRWWLGDSVLGALSHVVGGDMPALFVIVYVVSLLALFAAAAIFARSLGASWWTVAGFLVLLTLRHRIAKTGANSLEAYMQPRMLAFALGLAAFAAWVRRRPVGAILCTAAAGVIHTTTAFWFAAALAIAAIWRHPRRADLLLVAGALVAAGLAAVVIGPLAGHMTMIDPEWHAVLDDKDYLYSARWPLYAWLSNLAYLGVIAAAYRRRRSLGLATPNEGALAVGLAGLVVIFLISVPLTEGEYALAVQAQVNRIFWLLDAVTTFYIAWWLLDDRAARFSWSVRGRGIAIGVLLAITTARGFYILRYEARRPLFEIGLPENAWIDAMTWLRAQPASWHVLADPQHGWKYGVSVRVAAERDVLLEAGKDSALAIYDRDVAHRVAERSRAVGDFDHLSVTDVLALARRYDLDVLVDRADRTFPLPVLYRNAEFIIYRLQ